MLNAVGIILHENAKPSQLQEDHPMWQQEFTTFHRIPTKMPFQAVFMRGGAGLACMDYLVVKLLVLRE